MDILEIYWWFCSLFRHSKPDFRILWCFGQLKKIEVSTWILRIHQRICIQKLVHSKYVSYFISPCACVLWYCSISELFASIKLCLELCLKWNYFTYVNTWRQFSTQFVLVVAHTSRLFSIFCFHNKLSNCNFALAYISIIHSVWNCGANLREFSFDSVPFSNKTENKLNKFLIAHSWWIVFKLIRKIVAVLFHCFPIVCYIFLRLLLEFLPSGFRSQFMLFYRCHSSETHYSL